MSLLIKVLAGFPVVAGVSTYSLTLATNKDKEEKIEIVASPTVTPATEEEKVSPPAQEPPIVQEVKVQSVRQMMEEIIVKKNYEGCSEITAGKNIRGALWFVCFSKDGSNKPALYNYDRKRQDNKLTVVEVTSISSSPNREMTFVTGDKEKLKLSLSPSWLLRMTKDKNLIPAQNCNLVEGAKARGGEPTYTLSCNGEEIQKDIEFEKKKNSNSK